ncbi:carbon monoxide dehydrogenase subunit G [Bradyrhizobium sp. PRIMUS42]|uniref:SRPBCC family protein n=1 Tax=Bradyrhizobium sp. PRIMUS42 TaxID=2908926 RepID=UPI001FF28707|nr:carbon monoxide dehydrogenase subunit G [Bradyrhizobium sp. PRIMUS42]MCJ9728648.1 carbon monoxide dehydrogenase subunit G [Bradyrhizobium sp. PRIMUS42]
MDMRGQQHVAASRETVWKALNDPSVLRACIPGCQELAKTSDTEMTAVVVIKVGPVTARFQGGVILSDLDPPNGYKISGEGQGGVAGFAKGTAIVRLEEVDGGTLLHYEVDAQIGGKLSQLGGRLIDATARKLSALFFEKFAQEFRHAQSPIATAAPDREGKAPSGPGALTGEGHGEARFGSARAVSHQADRRHFPWRAFAAAVLIIGAAIIWFHYRDILPILVPARDPADGRTQISSDVASLVQLIMAAAIGYLFGARSSRNSV